MKGFSVAANRDPTVGVYSRKKSMRWFSLGGGRYWARFDIQGLTSIETAAEENREAAKRCLAVWPNVPMSQAIASQDGFLCGKPVMFFGVSIYSARRSVMPGIFGDRERAYEAKWAHDEEMRFKILVRRNNLLGHWAAGELGLSGQEAGEYATAIIEAGLADKDKDSVFRKIRDDFHAKKLGPRDASIHDKMEEFSRIVSAEMIKGLS